jgi:hypothetical protein
MVTVFDATGCEFPVDCVAGMDIEVIGVADVDGVGVLQAAASNRQANARYLIW